MAFPTGYTESTFNAYLMAEIGSLATDLGVVNLTEAMYDAMFAYETDDITTITGIANLRKIRALGKVFALRLLIVRASRAYDVSDGTQSFKRSQMVKPLEAALELAEADAQAAGVEVAGSTLTATIGTIRYLHDPYAHTIPDTSEGT